MQIMIDIPKEEYERLAYIDILKLRTYIENGTSLPKGHGRLIDESDLMPDSDYEDGMFYSVSIGAIHGAPTIIEEDKE